MSALERIPRVHIYREQCERLRAKGMTYYDIGVQVGSGGVAGRVGPNTIRDFLGKRCERHEGDSYHAKLFRERKERQHKPGNLAPIDDPQRRAFSYEPTDLVAACDILIEAMQDKASKVTVTSDGEVTIVPVVVTTTKMQRPPKKKGAAS